MGKKKKKHAGAAKQVFQTVSSMLVLFVLIVGISFVVLVVKDKLTKPEDPVQESSVDVLEASSVGEFTQPVAETTTTLPEQTTTNTEGTDITTDTVTETSPTHATQPPKVTKQTAQIIYNSSLHAKYTSKTSATTTTTTKTTTGDGQNTTSTSSQTQKPDDPYQAVYESYGTQLKAYLNGEHSDDKAPMYELLDLNDDECPELIISGGDDVESVSYVYSIVNGSLKPLTREDDAMLGQLEYAEEENRLIEVVWSDGVKYTCYYHFDGEKLVQEHAFSHTADGYTMDGAAVSYEEYIAAMHHDSAPVRIGRKHTLPDTADALTSVDGHPIS